MRDAKIYNPVLIGQKSISDGDSWVRYWEGNPVNLGGRTHPMGIMVEQRSMSWNFPAGNEDILYFVFTFYNVTARNASAYANLDPSIQADVAAVGAQFQDLNETKFGIQIPDSGYTVKKLYAAFGMDADVAVFSQNYATAFLPFNIGSEYSGTFLPEVGWRFPNDIFGDPFFAGAGTARASGRSDRPPRSRSGCSGPPRPSKDSSCRRAAGRTGPRRRWRGWE